MATEQQPFLLPATKCHAIFLYTEEKLLLQLKCDEQKKVCFQCFLLLKAENKDVNILVENLYFLTENLQFLIENMQFQAEKRPFSAKNIHNFLLRICDLAANKQF